MRGARERLVDTLREKGIRDLAVLRAFEMTPRHAFVPTGLRHRAYEDAPLPIGNGQTISQPWVHARYLELLHLTGKERVLEIGTGSGYQTVLLAHLAAQVFSIERIRHSSTWPARTSRKPEYATCLVDGRRQCRLAVRAMTFVGAGAPSMQPLLDQLADGGRLPVPIGDRGLKLVLAERKNGSITMTDIAPCVRAALGFTRVEHRRRRLNNHATARRHSRQVQGVGFRWFVRSSEEARRGLGQKPEVSAQLRPTRTGKRSIRFDECSRRDPWARRSCRSTSRDR